MQLFCMKYGAFLKWGFPKSFKLLDHLVLKPIVLNCFGDPPWLKKLPYHHSARGFVGEIPFFWGVVNHQKAPLKTFSHHKTTIKTQWYHHKIAINHHKTIIFLGFLHPFSPFSLVAWRLSTLAWRSCQPSESGDPGKGDSSWSSMRVVMHYKWDWYGDSPFI